MHDKHARMSDDRTAEFFTLARNLPDSELRLGQSSSLQGGHIGTSASSPYGGRYGGSNIRNLSSSQQQQQQQQNPAYNELRSFHKTAADISRDIAATSSMLSELAQLVRQKSLFVDDSDRINGLVLRIKSNIENLNVRLEDAGTVISQQKRRLGRQSQAGQEADNLVGQLKEEFVQATAGFKKVLQQRTDSMKETTDRKLQVYGAHANGGDAISLVRLENKPAVYELPAGANHTALAQGHSFPTLDLTSGMAAGESSSSASQLPRPRKYCKYGYDGRVAPLTRNFCFSRRCFGTSAKFG